MWEEEEFKISLMLLAKIYIFLCSIVWLSDHKESEQLLTVVYALFGGEGRQGERQSGDIEVKQVWTNADTSAPLQHTIKLDFDICLIEMINWMEHSTNENY